MSYFPYIGAIPAHITDEVLEQQTHTIEQQDTLVVQNASYHLSPESTLDWHVKELLINFIEQPKKEDLINVFNSTACNPKTATHLTICNREFSVRQNRTTQQVKVRYNWGTGIFSRLIKCIFCYFFHRPEFNDINEKQKVLKKYLNDPHIQAFFRHILENYEIFEPASLEYSEEISRKNLRLCVGALKAHLRDYLQGNTVNLKPLHANFVLEFISTDT